LIPLQHHIQAFGNGNFLLDEGQNHGYISGNKLRKFNGIVKGNEDAKGFITLGSVFSSHCMTTAFYGAYLKKKVVLIIIAEDEVDPRDYPHLKASIDFGAKILFVRGDEATNFIDQQKDAFKEYLWIPGGGHTSEAAEEYKIFFEGLFVGNQPLSSIERIVLPFGTGTTAIGICQAVFAQKLPIQVIGVSVARSKSRCLKAAQEFLQSKAELSILEINDDYQGRYHDRTQVTEAARQRFLKDTSILPDPIYNAKSIEFFYRENMSNTLIVNTGGALNNLL
jgi:1-aminocyclopropane-1-carboxylate deaminase/D-cysteine desulfhydrase-like pyridoxal-dependent ACC family enzyme